MANTKEFPLMTTLSGVSANQLAVANPWSMVPPLGNLDAYISAANRLPLLTLEEEQGFARKLRDLSLIHI